MRAPTLTTFRSGVARRLFVTFICCALIPIIVIGGLAFRELDHVAVQRATDRLASASGGFGMELLARMAAADDVLRLTVGQRPGGSATGADADDLQGYAPDLFDRISTLDWAPTGVRSVGPQPAISRAGSLALPPPSATQLDVLRRGGPVLMWAHGKDGAAHVFLLRADRVERRIVAAELTGALLWGSPEELPAGSGIVVAAQGGPLLHASPNLPASLVQQLLSGLAAGTLSTQDSRRALWRSADGNWQAYRWDTFLRGAYASPSWSVIAVEPRKTLLGEIGPWRVIFPTSLLATLLIVLLLAAAQIRRLFSPLEDLIAATRRLARGEFDTSVDTSSSDELGELARSFNSMTASLQDQFATLLTMAEVDRLLLESSQLERVLDALLPRIARVSGCATASVLLLDTDSADQARVYDFCSAAPESLPVRRVCHEVGGLQIPAAASGCRVLEQGGKAPLPPFLEEMVRQGSSRFELWPVRRGADLAGLLCLGYAADASARSSQRGREFADRLSVVLANVSHEAALYQQAHFDALTQLPNRLLFRDRLAGDLAQAREDRARGALLYIDLDRFKRVNDTAGHGAGDELLKIVGRRIATCLRESDTVARLGGDEFAVVLHRIDDPQFARTMGERILAALREPIPAGDREHYVGASLGVAVFPDDGDTLDELLKHSDIALYRAKDAGRGQIVFYEPAMHARVQTRASLELDLRRALRDGHFELHWQPICAARQSRLFSVEALLRCAGPNGGHPPSVFIPVAEESGLIVEIGRWVLDAAVRQLAAWRAAGIAIPKISVNVSPRQLREPDFAAGVLECLRRHAIDPGLLELEITESVMAEGATAERLIRELAQAGVSLALDDFGTGYSSLAYLRTLPIDTVKIDRSFITDIPGSPTACQLVEAILAMCRSLGKRVVAEGVETPDQLHFLEERGCDALQGYLFARPEPAERFAARRFTAAGAAQSPVDSARLRPARIS